MTTPKNILTSLFILLFSAISAQEYFMTRTNLGKSNSVLNSVVETDSSFIVSAIAVDTLISLYTGIEIIEFTKSGEIINNYISIDSSFHKEPWGRNATIINNEFYYTGYTRNDSQRKLLIGKYSPSIKENTVVEFSHPGYPDQFFTGGQGVLKNDNSLYYYGNYQQTAPNSNNGSNGLILKVDPNLNIIDTSIVHFPVPFEGLISDMATLNSGGFLVALSTQERGVVCEPYTGFKLLIKDEQLNTIAEYTSPTDEIWTLRPQLFQANDGNIYLSVNRVEWSNFIFGSGPDDCISTPFTAPTILKFTEDLEPIWQKDLLRPIDTLGFSNTVDIVAAHEGDGMVTAYDSFIIGDTTAVDRITQMVKFDTAGNIIWRRLFYQFDSIGANDQVKDLIATSDGGYLFVGESIYWSEDNLPPGQALGQQGWIVKVDRFGCLIPGCEGPLSTDDTSPIATESELLLYPNPVAHDLFYQLPLQGVGLVFQTSVFDISGRLIKSLPQANYFEGATYIANIADLPPGQYVLRVTGSKGQFSKKFVKK